MEQKNAVAFAESITSGQLSLILKEGVQDENDPDKFREPTLEEVLLDPDFLAEARIQNEAVCAYFTFERVLQVVNYITQEPKFDDSHKRCFILPKIACECFCDIRIQCFVDHLFTFKDGKLTILDKMLEFYNLPCPHLTGKGSKRLNQTLGGYLHKILSYWLMKKPNIILNYLLEPKRKLFFVEAMFNHLYLASCITDLVVRLCTVSQVPEDVDLASYEELRQDIAAHCINQLDTFEDNEYLTWQIFEILT